MTNSNWRLKISLVVILPLLLFFVWLLPDEHGVYPVALRRLAGLVFQEGLTPAQAAAKYAAGDFRLLIVPGHDTEFSGAQFGRLKEADLNLALAERLAFYLTPDEKLKIFTTRDWSSGDYRPEFLDYFAREREAIRSFRARLRAQFVALVKAGAVTETVVVSHNFAPAEAAIRLYGLNKWANEQGIDLTLHLHFNDDAERPPARAGRYRGFAIYIPEAQLPAHHFGRELGERLKQKLSLAAPVSNLPLEAAGVIEDQELIAVGANGSRERASLLIEYGYLYEPQFLNPAARAAALETLARRTAEGIKDYLTSIQ